MYFLILCVVFNTRITHLYYSGPEIQMPYPVGRRLRGESQKQ